MGLDVYAGPVSRYVGGSWSTIVQQGGAAVGVPVITLRPGDSIEEAMKRALAGGAAASPPAQAPSLEGWKAAVMRQLGVNEEWDDNPQGEFVSDQPGWWGYGAVMLLAAYDEQPSLAPGAKVKRLVGSRTVAAVAPESFAEAEAFKAASQSPTRYPTLLRAEWCLPLAGGPVLFAAPTPSGKQVTMGHVDRLLSELVLLNERTLRLSAADLATARRNEGEPDLASFAAMAPFGLSVLMAAAEFAAQHRVAWILDY